MRDTYRPRSTSGHYSKPYTPEPLKVRPVMTYLDRWLAWRIAEGYTYKQISLELGLNLPSTIKYIQHFYYRLGISNGCGQPRQKFIAWWESHRQECNFIEGKGLILCLITFTALTAMM